MEKVVLRLRYNCIKDVLNNGTYHHDSSGNQVSPHLKTLDALLAEDPEQMQLIHDWCLEGAELKHTVLDESRYVGSIALACRVFSTCLTITVDSRWFGCARCLAGGHG